MRLHTHRGPGDQRRSLSLWHTGSLLCIALGCGDPSLAPDVSPRIVIQGLLVLGAEQQSVWVEWSTPADSEFSAAPRPIDPAAVSLEIVAPDGESLPLVAAAQAPGRFDARVILRAEGVYGLRGIVNGRSISASTVVPTQLQILSPASDTVRIMVGSCFVNCQMPYVWHAAGANAYQYSQKGEGVGGTRGIARDTAGVLELEQAPAGATTRLTTLAYDSNAAAFLLGTVPQGTIQGAFGFFGSASFAEKILVWE